ncbi:hypothetical protein PVAND_007046 [Polypedilum vanderplanki]|uniref:Queuine tRNA-ribosyltransferase accessory subunit 2 n=1 Tax=Polypedilum vanderplanki TaxID=319348 RepID=A0A9J6C516_POLVA|nr:hypothetical protein PVAND_007046 [Polypedilum vanderplanki]
MKFVVELSSKCSGRLGLLSNIERLPERCINTPFLLFVNPNLSREVLELNFCLKSDFGVALPISKTEQMEEPLQLSKKGISEFIGLSECLTFLTFQNTSELTRTGHHEKGSIPVFRTAGKINLNTQRYMNIVEVSKPDFYLSLADSDTWKDCPKRRLIKSNERSQEFFEECISHHKKINSKSKLIATVEGGYNMHERKKCIDYLKKEDEYISGFLIDGFHRNGFEATQVDVDAMTEIVEKTVEILNNDKVRLMFGAYLPHVTLQLISLGIDIFDSSFIQIVTNMNRALVFNFDINNPVKRFPEIDLTDEKYKEDFTGFLENCDCLACRQHTKAYVNHLLITKELLAPMLLTIHNLHHYKRFFEVIRECIKNNKLPELIKLVTDQYKEAGSLIYEQPEITDKYIKKHNASSK